jgi:hypothetical protein
MIFKRVKLWAASLFLILVAGSVFAYSNAAVQFSTKTNTWSPTAVSIPGVAVITRIIDGTNNVSWAFGLTPAEASAEKHDMSSPALGSGLAYYNGQSWSAVAVPVSSSEVIASVYPFIFNAQQAAIVGVWDLNSAELHYVLLRHETTWVESNILANSPSVTGSFYQGGYMPLPIKIINGYLYLVGDMTKGDAGRDIAHYLVANINAPSLVFKSYALPQPSTSMGTYSYTLFAADASSKNALYIQAITATQPDSPSDPVLYTADIWRLSPDAATLVIPNLNVFNNYGRFPSLVTTNKNTAAIQANVSAAYGHNRVIPGHAVFLYSTDNGLNWVSGPVDPSQNQTAMVNRWVASTFNYFMNDTTYCAYKGAFSPSADVDCYDFSTNVWTQNLYPNPDGHRVGNELWVTLTPQQKTAWFSGVSSTGVVSLVRFDYATGTYVQPKLPASMPVVSPDAPGLNPVIGALPASQAVGTNDVSGVSMAIRYGAHWLGTYVGGALHADLLPVNYTVKLDYLLTPFSTDGRWALVLVK